ncbi:MAG: hypothetical protein A3I78_04395 [Gammaproteobacteria bacterium RIFCSPLOWO2_02_FULL_56_15]|nr:MAG: hypothetical protein A3I78_04395 [Gammaproteobacteria bacterium RIFCSPLOWO2_02_FULL_56_15]
MPALYHWEPNTFYLKPLIALHEKGVRFSSHYIDPTATAFDIRPDCLDASIEVLNNPEREGPMLIESGEVICGSFFMLEFIADFYPGPELAPRDPMLYYRIQEIGQTLGVQLATLVGPLGCERYLLPKLRKRDAVQLNAALSAMEPVERRHVWQAVLDLEGNTQEFARLHSKLAGSLQEIESLLDASDWLVGEDYSIADIEVFSMIHSLPVLTPELLHPGCTPKIVSFLQRMQSRPAVRAALAMSRTGHPERCFVPGIEPSRWLGL